MSYVPIKIKIVAFLLLFSLIAYSQDSPFQAGVKGGMSFSSASVKNAGTERIKAGYQIGLFAEYGLTESFYLQSGAYFATKGIRLKGTKALLDVASGWKQTVDMQYVEVPLLAMYKLEIVSGMKILFNAGPYASLGIGGKTTNKLIGADESKEVKLDTFDENRMKDFDYGVRFGTGMEFEKMIFEFSFDFGINNIAYKDNELNSAFGDKHFRNKGFSLLVGYKF